MLHAHAEVGKNIKIAVKIKSSIVTTFHILHNDFSCVGYFS